MDPLDCDVELERLLIVIVGRHRRPERDTDVKALGAVNAIGVLMGTVPWATTSPFTFIAMSSGPRGS